VEHYTPVSTLASSLAEGESEGNANANAEQARRPIVVAVEGMVGWGG